VNFRQHGLVIDLALQPGLEFREILRIGSLQVDLKSSTYIGQVCPNNVADNGNWSSNYLTGIHDVFRVQGHLNSLHEACLGLAAIADQLLADLGDAAKNP
jgi:hypothetical protein